MSVVYYKYGRKDRLFIQAYSSSLALTEKGTYMPLFDGFHASSGEWKLRRGDTQNQLLHSTSEFRDRITEAEARALYRQQGMCKKCGPFKPPVIV